MTDDDLALLLLIVAPLAILQIAFIVADWRIAKLVEDSE